MHVLQVVEHVIALKTSFPQNANLEVVPCIIIMLSPLGCLRVHSKYSLACHWLFNWPGMEEQEFEEDSLETNVQTRTFPSHNASRVKADGMGSTYQ